MGDLRQGAGAYERVLRADPACLDAWVHLAQARKEVRQAHCSAGLPHSHRLHACMDGLACTGVGGIDEAFS